MDYTNNNQQKKADHKIIYGVFLLITVFCLIALFAIGMMVSNNKTRKPPTPSISPAINLEEQLSKQANLKKFKNYDDLVSYLENNTASSNNYYGLDTIARPMTAEFGTSFPNEAGLADNNQKAAEGLGGGSDDYSTTNIQVAGVDEADIIKTDGKYIYLTNGKTIFIIDAVPASEAKIISKIELDAPPQNIYINKNRIVAFGYEYNLPDRKNFDFILPRTNYTYLNIYDAKDKYKPELVKELHFEGNYVNSRMIGDYIYFITSKYPNVWANDVMPRTIDNDKLVCSDNNLGSKRCPSIYYFDIPYPSYQLTSVSAINIENENKDVVQNIYLMGETNNIYVSTNSLYITNTKYLDEYQLAMEVAIEVVEPRLPKNLKIKLAKIRQVDSDILNAREKLQKINSLIQYFLSSLSSQEQLDIQKEIENKTKDKIAKLENELEKTIIHKIAINGEKMELVAQGEVPGTVLNQFSMDEDNGYFRIATTRNRRWSRFYEQPTESYSNLYILDDKLNIAGKLEGLAPGERIYAARFMQNRAYLVTFKQVDPLFVIDLSEPKNPKILGKLKIPGYSNYLHPYNNDLLIGLGQNTTTNEWGAVRNQGVKLSLFDVSDVSNPKEIDSYVFSEANSHSLAQNDHKAFLFSKEKNLLVVPVNAWDYQNQEKSYNAAFVFKIDGQGFELRGKIDHSRQTCEASECGTTINEYDHSAQVLRSLYIKNNLYTMSNKYLKINNLQNLTEINSLTIAEQNNQPTPLPEPIPLPLKEELR